MQPVTQPRQRVARGRLQHQQPDSGHADELRPTLRPRKAIPSRDVRNVAEPTAFLSHLAQLAALVSLIALINAYNRVNVIVQQPAGDYQPGQFG
jgi:hypothetical protein